MAFLWLMNGGLLLSTCLSLKTTYLYAYTRNQDVGVSKNRSTPKWMVKIMENLIKMDDLGGCFPPFLVKHPCFFMLDSRIRLYGR